MISIPNKNNVDSVQTQTYTEQNQDYNESTYQSLSQQLEDLKQNSIAYFEDMEKKITELESNSQKLHKELDESYDYLEIMEEKCTQFQIKCDKVLGKCDELGDKLIALKIKSDELLEYDSSDSDE